MSYNSKRTGAEVEALLDKAESAMQSIPSEYVTESELTAKGYATATALTNGLSGKVDKVSGKQLSTNDYTSTEKSKLAGIASGAEVNVQSDWSATDTSSDAYIKNKPSLAAVATSGSYSDLSNKPSIPSAVSESTVSGWGFTKNTGTYSKPSGGIPKTDLASAIQISLGKADTALQSYSESDPVFKASAAAGITSSDISNWNSKTNNTGTVTGVKINGSTKSPSSGVVDLGTVLTAHQDISGKLDSSTAASTYAKRITVSSASAASATISPNIFYVWGTMTSLSITALNTPSDSSIYNEYMFQFTSGSSATTLSVPSTVKWVVEPNIEANKTYQVSIVNNVGIIVGV